MTDAPSFQDLLNNFADEVFVGRGEQLTLFEGALKASQPAFLILNISGQGGVGKTTLLERYSQISKNNEVAYASVTEDHLAVPKILEVFVAQLKEDGLDFDAFNERYRKYLELKEKVESDPKVPSGLMDFALRGIAKVGVKSLKRIPVAGDVADVFLNPESEEAIVGQASEFTKYIFQKFTNKDERVLLLDTDAELTRHFLEDITKALKHKRAVLCFDTYEKTAESIEKWLINLLMGGYGHFSSNILFVIAGRYSLGQSQNWTRFRKAIRQIELQEFTEDEAKDYITRSGITDEKLISQFIEISDRLPVLLALLVSSPNQLPHDVSGDAVQRFLQGQSPEQQEAALISSLPRYFNSDILTSILGEQEGKKAFEWLSKAHFVRTSENGWVYHDVVRAMMLRYFRMRSSQQFIEVHKHLEEYYQEQITNLLSEKDILKINTTTSKFEAEKTYHFLCQNPLKNVEFLVKLFTATYWELRSNTLENSSDKKNVEETYGFLTASYSNCLLQLCDEISDLMAKEEIDNFRNLAKLFSGESSDKESKLFDWLLNINGLNDQEKSAVFILKANSDKDSTELTSALNDLNKVIQLNPSSIVSYVIRAEHFENNKNYDLALLDLSKAIELQPKNAYIYKRCGNIYKELKDYHIALINFSKAIELQPEDGDNYFWRGVTYYDMEDYHAAIADFSKSTEQQPESWANQILCGLSYFNIKDYPAALTNFSKAIELQPEDGGNFWCRGQTYYEMKDYSNALTDLSKAIELQPENGSNYNWRGATYYGKKDYFSALTDFSKAIELQPENGVNYNWRGRTYYEMKDYPKALTDLSKAIELQPENGVNYNSRGRTYHEMKDYPNALADFSKAIELQPESGSNHNGRGATYYEMKNYPNALIDLSKAIELAPDDGDNYYWRGRTYYDMKDYSSALTNLSKAIELQPEDGYNYHWRGQAYYEMKDYSSALTNVSKAIELQPEDGYNYYWRGQTYYKMKDYPNALTDLSKAIELQPEDGNNYYWRGQTYYEMKDYSAALTDFSKAIELQPADGTNYNWRGRTYYRLENYPTAINDFAKAIELTPKSVGNYYRRSICNFVLNNKEDYKADIQKAIQLFESEEGEKGWFDKFMQALCYLANEEPEKARKLYEETISQCSEKDAMEYGLEILLEFIELTGSSPKTKNIENLFNVALSK